MVMRKFPELRKFSWSSSFAEKWNTTVQKSASGRVRTLTNQLYPAWTITASYPALTDAQADELLGFVAHLKGALEPFLWLDPEHNFAKNMQLGKINDKEYQCFAAIGDYIESVRYAEDVVVYVNNQKVALDSYIVTDGVVVFNDTPDGIVTADYTYYWQVILSDDGLSVSKKFADINTASLKMEVVR